MLLIAVERETQTHTVTMVEDDILGRCCINYVVHILNDKRMHAGV